MFGSAAWFASDERACAAARKEDDISPTAATRNHVPTSPALRPALTEPLSPHPPQFLTCSRKALPLQVHLQQPRGRRALPAEEPLALRVGIVGLGGYVFIRKDAIIDSAKSKILEAVMPSLGGIAGDALPDITGPALPSLPSPSPF